MATTCKFLSFASVILAVSPYCLVYYDYGTGTLYCPSGPSWSYLELMRYCAMPTASGVPVMVTRRS